MTTELPAVISRRMDPRAGVSVVWGIVHAGSAPNVIPDRGLVAGTVRILDAVAWAECEPIIREAILEIVRPYGVTAFVDYQRGVPPVVNDPASNAVLAAAVHDTLGVHGQVTVPQSLGGEDYGWYLEQVPGRHGPARHPPPRWARRTTSTRAIWWSTSALSASAPGCSPAPPCAGSESPEGNNFVTGVSGRRL